MPVSLGMNEVETSVVENLYNNLNRAPRTLDVVVASGEGVIAKGTIMSLDTVAGKYIQWDGTKDMAGVTGEAIDATSADVKTFLLFDFDANVSAVIGGATVNVGFDATSLINFK